jgi:hypothetical protein
MALAAAAGAVVRPDVSDKSMCPKVPIPRHRFFPSAG